MYSLQFDMQPDFVAGAQTLCGEINNSIKPNRLDWSISLDLGAMPVGQDAIFEIESSSDQGNSWTSVFLPGNQNKLVVGAGGVNYGTVTTFIDSPLLAGSLARARCLQAGVVVPGKGLQVNLYGGAVTKPDLLWDDAPGLFDNLPGTFDSPG